LSTAAYMIETSQASLLRLAASVHQLPGYAWADRLLSIALASRFSAPGAIAKLSAEASGAPAMTLPVVIVTGGSAADLEAETRRYYSLLEESFEHFRGVLVSGGTTQGVSALVGRLREKHTSGIRAIGYLPAALPDGVTEDARYDEIRHTCGADLGPWEPLQYWTDILSSELRPADLRLLDFGGGALSAAELRIAVALGAQVGVVRGSGRAADELLGDRDWMTSPTLMALEPSNENLRSFLRDDGHNPSRHRHGRRAGRGHHV
jgi:hypothetical protein